MAIKTPLENIILLPREVLPKVKNASAEELKALIYFFANPDSSVTDCAVETGLTVAQVESASAFWRGAGIFSDSEAPKKKIVRNSNAYRNYDSETLADAIENDSGFSMIYNFAIQRLEKLINKNEQSSLYHLYSFMGMSAPIVCGIIEYCCANNKSNCEYIFRMGTTLFDEGIDTYDKFEAYIAKRNEIKSNVGQLRRLCGMGDRALTSKEQKLFDCWFGEWNLPFEMVKSAYEKTVDNTGKLSTTYMNSILRRWHESGYASLADVESGEASRPSGGNSSSFTSDEFMEAALNRGFGD